MSTVENEIENYFQEIRKETIERMGVVIFLILFFFLLSSGAEGRENEKEKE